VLIATLLLVQGCGSSGDSSEPAQVGIPSVTAPTIPQPDQKTTTTKAEVAPTTNAEVAPKRSHKPARADAPASGTQAAADQNSAKRGGSRGSGDGKSNAAEDTKRAGSGAQSGTPESTSQGGSTEQMDEQRAGG
jgi:hypothetical protein